jgi:3'-5' exoribonuclease
MSDRGWPDPRTWVGDAPFPWPAAALLQPGESHSGCYSVVSIGHARDSGGQAGLEIELSDAHGVIHAWLPADSGADWLRPGLYVGVHGTIVDAGGWSLLDIGAISPVQVGLPDLALFLPHSSADLDALERELSRLVRSVGHDGLRALLERMLGGETEIGRGFRLAPAATRNHHACLGGLFEHTISVARLCDFAASHYGDDIDRDLLIAGALLHDIGKVREIGARTGFPYTDEGRLLGHILLGLQMTAAAARGLDIEPETRLLLEHLIAAHQGRHEWQSPREPLIIEAFILHYLDDLDAKVDHVRSALGTVEAGWTEYDRSLRRELLNHEPTGRVRSAADTPGTTADAGAPSAAGKADAADRSGSASEPTPGSGSGKTDRSARKRSRKKARPKKKSAKSAKKTGKAGQVGKTRKKAKRAAPRRPSTTPARQTSSPEQPAARQGIIEPGMPGFVDTDTLDLFEQE